MTQNWNGHSNFNGWRTQPMYTFSEAAQLARVSTSTVRNWLRGYSGPERDTQPIFTTHDRNVAMVSFLNLIEIVIEREVMTRLFGVSLVTFKIVNRRSNLIAR